MPRQAGFRVESFLYLNNGCIGLIQRQILVRQPGLKEEFISRVPELVLILLDGYPLRTVGMGTGHKGWLGQEA